MSQQELNELIEATADFTAWNLEETPKELIEKLQVVTVDNLPEEFKEYKVKEEQADGARIITAEAAVNEIGHNYLFVDTSSVPVSDLHYLNLYTSLIGKTYTKKLSEEQVSTDILQYLHSLSIKPSISPNSDGTFSPVLSASWLNLSDDYEKSVQLINELVFSTSLTDTEKISHIIAEQKSYVRQKINSEPFQALIMRARSSQHDEYNYWSYLNGIEYYNFLIEAEKMLKDDPEAFCARLQSVQNAIRNKNGATIAYMASGDSIEKNKDNFTKVFDGIESKEIVKAELDSLPKAENREALVVDSTVMYNLIYASLEELGLQESGIFEPLNLMIHESYLTPEIRHNIGAYGIIVNFDKYGFMLMSYRDPGIAPTYEVYKGLANYAANAPVSQEDLDRYIIKSYSSSALTFGELQSARQAVQYYIEGRDLKAEKLKKMREIKSFSVEDLRNMAPVFEKLNQIGMTSTAGSAAIIEQNKDRFDNIIYWDSESNQDTTYLTRSTLLKILYDAENGDETAKENGVMLGYGNGEYHEDKYVTRQEFAVFLSRLFSIYEYDNVEVSDIDLVSDWAKQAVLDIVGNGYIILGEDNVFDPHSNITMNDVLVTISNI